MRGFTPPTAPVKVAVPAVPARIVNELAPFTVLEKLIDAPPALPPLFVLSKIGALVKITGPVIPITPPLVVRFPPILTALDPL